MSKAKDRYYKHELETQDYTIVQKYVSELEQQNEEMLKWLIDEYAERCFACIEQSIGCASRYPSNGCSNNLVSLIEKITGKSIDEVLNDD